MRMVMVREWNFVIARFVPYRKCRSSGWKEGKEGSNLRSTIHALIENGWMDALARVFIAL